MQKTQTTIFFFLYFSSVSFGQIPVASGDSLYKVNKRVITKQVFYPFLVADSYNSTMTMKMASQNANSTARVLWGYVNSISNKKDSEWMGLIFFGLETIFYPFSHEEGHRSVLSYENIGSVADAFPNLSGLAIVRGVSDSMLIQLRANKLPTYIRLHTGGLESDYMRLMELRKIAAFDEDLPLNTLHDRMLTTSAIAGYYFLSIFPQIQPHIVKSKNQLENDIVGHDVYGAIKNLFRPNIPFYRYTYYENLTGVEKKYLNKVAFMSLANIVGPTYLKLKASNGTVVSLGLGYTMVPFGSMLEGTIYVHDKESDFDWGHTIRDYENNSGNFGLGLGFFIRNWKVSPNFRLDAEGEFFRQPLNLDFNTYEFFYGGSADLLASYDLRQKYKLPFLVNLGVRVKTDGFVLGEPSLKSGIFFRAGCTLVLNREVKSVRSVKTKAMKWTSL